MKAKIVLENSLKARTAISILEKEGIEKSSITVVSPSKDQVEKLLRLQSLSDKSLSLNTNITVAAVGAICATSMLLFLMFAHPGLNILMKIIAVCLVAVVGSFFAFLISLFRFSGRRAYNSIKIIDKRKVSESIALEFKLDIDKKRRILESLSKLEPIDINF